VIRRMLCRNKSIFNMSILALSGAKDGNFCDALLQ